MRTRSRLVFNGFALLFGTLLAVAACSKNSGSGSLPAPTPTPPTSITFNVAAGGSSQPIPASFGYTGSIIFPPATAGAGTPFTITETGPNPPSGAPSLGLPNAPLLYFNFVASNNVTFTGFPGISITIPSSITTTGQQFFIAFFDTTNPAAGWITNYRGPATVSGQTLTFPGSSTPFTFKAGQSYDYVLYAVQKGATPSPPPITRFIYVSNGSNATGMRNTILIFPANANGNVPPAANLSGASTQLNNPNGLAFGVGTTGGVLYVANGGGTITEYAQPAMGNQAPLVVLGGGASGLVSPQFVASDLSGQVYVTQNAATGGVDSVEVFPANAMLGTPPKLTITSGLSTPMGVGADATPNFYVANNGSNSVNEYDATGALIATISGAMTTLNKPTGLSVDGTGDVFVAQATNSILVFKGPLAKGNNNVAPSQTISGGSTLLNSPAELWLDGHMTLYVANNGTGSNANAILTFPSTTSGNVFPLQFISGSLTQIAQPFGVAAY
ncbi:MAG: hypothetical protein JO024_08960 [Candidatus Eremiobacteraeota bacterium]|nr:hypothetical protein [Candidatus Eremiobacteraeota bacterium]MBV9736909.1 hypothetical protein [Candidatus Eremiobacteraeota bacterium]